MIGRYLTILLALSFLFAGCIPNKRLVYLQHEPEPKRGAVSNTDSLLLRSYDTKFTEYALKPRDIISLRVASVTPSEFDFVRKYEEQLGIIRKLNQYEQSNQVQSMTQRMQGTGVGEDGVMSTLLLDRQPTGFILDEEGFLELPYIGRVQLAEKTLPECEELIREKLKGYFETPVVRLQLLSFHFTILGEVNKEGRYTIYDPNATIIDAISLAGNLNDFADRSKIKIARMEGGQAKVFYVNTLKEDLLGQEGFYVKPGDIIIVPPLGARASRKYTLPTYTTAISLITSTLTLILVLTSR